MNKEQVTKKPPYLMIVVLFVGAFVAFLNNTLLNVALPTMSEDLGVDYPTIQWLANGYMLVSGILTPASAYFITRYNTRPLFIVSTIIFTLGTLLAALAPVFGVLLAGRMLQAVGAAFMGPLLMNVMLISFPIEKRGTAMGVFGLVMITAPAIGPTLSGYIVEHYHWRFLFIMILPFAVISILLSLWKLENVLPTRKINLDYLSLVLSTFGFGGLLYGFSAAGKEGFTNPIVITTFIIGIIGVIVFILRQLKLETPVLDMGIFKSPMYALGSVINAVLFMALMGGMILIPAYVQEVRDIEPFVSGLMMLPGAVIMAIMSPITGKLFDKIGPKLLAIVGLTITTVTTYLLSLLDMNTSILYIVSVFSIRSFGMSLVMMPITTNSLNSLNAKLYPHGTAANNTIQQISGAIGTAILVAIMYATSATIGQDLTTEAKINGTLTADLESTIESQALLEGIQMSFLVATFIAFISLILTLFIKRVVNPNKLHK